MAGISSNQIRQNLLDVRARISAAAERSGRDPASIELVAVTKSVGIDEVRVLYDLGLRHFGENRVENAQSKIETLPSDIHWHMIGNIQRRKTRDVVAFFDYIDAVDRLVLAEALQQRCEQHNRADLPVLLEVNISDEATKQGFSADTFADALRQIQNLSRLHVRGCMTMAPYVHDPEETRPIFMALKHLAQDHGLQSLSMGMSNDYEVAIEEGATEVRIGSALYND